MRRRPRATPSRRRRPTSSPHRTRPKSPRPSWRRCPCSSAARHSASTCGRPSSRSSTAAVTIGDPDAPIGTVIYTALNYTNEGADVRWNALAMYANATDPRPARDRRRTAAPSATSRQRRPTPRPPRPRWSASRFPQDAIDRINEVVSPGSSLIISDEAASRGRPARARTSSW